MSREHGLTFGVVLLAAALGSLLATWAANNVQAVREVVNY